MLFAVSSGGGRTRCSSCNREFGDGSLSCPHCGAPAQLPVSEIGPLKAKDSAARSREKRTELERRSKIAKLAVGVLVGILLSVLLVHGLSAYFEKMGADARRTNCIANQRVVDKAIQNYFMENARFPRSMGDLTAPGSQVLMETPRCPSGRKPYIWVEGEDDKAPFVSCPNRSDHK